MASRAKLLSYIGFMAGDCGAYVGHVAPQCVAMAAIWLPKTHHLVPKWVRFGVLGLLCWPHGYEACSWCRAWKAKTMILKSVAWF